MNDTVDVAELLARHRPDRYRAGERDWQQSVIDAVAADIDAFTAKQLAAEQIVSRSEASATRRTNRFMRSVLGTGGLPLDWMDQDRWPLAVGDERVCLGALTGDDLDLFALDEEARANKDHSARLDAVKGARMLHDQLGEYRCRQIRDLGRRLFGSN